MEQDWQGLDCYTGEPVGGTIVYPDQITTGCIIESSLTYTEKVLVLETNNCTTTTTTTACNPSTPHPFSVNGIQQTDLDPFSSYFPSQLAACDAAACLQSLTCNVLSQTVVYFDNSIKNVGDIAYGSDIGCSTGFTNDGWYIFKIGGIYTVVEIIDSVIVSFPTC